MVDWKNTLEQLCPTVASALLGPMGGIAITALGSVLGVSAPTQDKIADIITNAQLTPDHVAEIKKLELKYQNDEAERGFKYANLAFQNQDSARKANVEGGVQRDIFFLSLFLLSLSLGCEIFVLFYGYPKTIPEIIVGRILGLLDSVSLMVLGYHYGTSASSVQKNQLLANSVPSK